MTSSSKVLVIYTGGTIGMQEDPVRGGLRPFDFGALINEVPEVGKFAVKIDSYTFSPLIDSSDVEPSMWVKLACLIRDRYDEYDGFVILHGTDTMAYSASALSFMLSGLSKPVIFTGSQLPIGVPRTDGKENLVSAIEIAAARNPGGEATVPEVCIYFNSHLMRGNRTTKISSEAFSAFDSPNYPCLAEAGINIRFNRDAIFRPSSWDVPLTVQTELDTRVSILKIHPGITPSMVRHFLLDEDTRAVVMETYGSGNAPSAPWLLEIVDEAVCRGKIILNVTQCQAGSVNMDIYATGRSLKEAGVVSGFDSTTEAALGKLFVLMGRSKDNLWVRERLERDLRGEITK